eukprot:2489991-Rhodomonas_salina.2
MSDQDRLENSDSDCRGSALSKGSCNVAQSSYLSCTRAVLTSAVPLPGMQSNYVPQLREKRKWMQPADR